MNGMWDSDILMERSLRKVQGLGCLLEGHAVGTKGRGGTGRQRGYWAPGDRVNTQRQEPTGEGLGQHCHAISVDILIDSLVFLLHATE